MKIGLDILGVLFFILGAWIIYAIVPTYAFKVWNFFKGTFKKKSETGRSIALTFDDGPSPRYTTLLLDLLARYDIKATFFVVGIFAHDNPELIDRMIRQGHEVGTHSFAHSNGLFLAPHAQKGDFLKTMKTLNSLGIEPVWCRPPWGHFNLYMCAKMKQFGLRPFLWNVMAQDWKAAETVDDIERKLMARVSRNSVVCLHDGRGRNDAPRRTIAALERVIPQWIEQGYIFKTASEYVQ